MRKSIIILIVTASVICTAAWAQPPDYAVYPGDERPEQGRQHQDRLARIVEYLELSDAQAAEWEQIASRHLETVRGRWELIGGLREEFRTLADQENPNLEQAGRIALDLHREMETARSSRGEIAEELVEILTPEQAERFEALQAAREFSGERRQRGGRGHRSNKDSG